jgi:hypothetical protein
MVVATAVPSQLEEILRFEEEEQEIFWNTFYPVTEIQDTFFDAVDSCSYQILQQKTKEGLRQGVKNFLGRQGPPPASIYLVDPDVLYEFCFDDSTELAIRERLKDTCFGTHQYLDDYCKDVCGGYRLYVLNESGDRYRERFETNRKAQCG